MSFFATEDYPEILWITKKNGVTGEIISKLSINVRMQKEETKARWRDFFSKTSWYAISKGREKNLMDGNSKDNVHYIINDATRTIKVDEKNVYSDIQTPAYIAVKFARYMLREDE